MTLIVSTALNQQNLFFFFPLLHAPLSFISSYHRCGKSIPNQNVRTTPHIVPERLSVHMQLNVFVDISAVNKVNFWMAGSGMMILAWIVLFLSGKTVFYNL